MNVIPADVSEFFLKTVRNKVEYRKANNVIRNDFLQILIDFMKDDSGLTIEEIAAQAFVFFEVMRKQPPLAFSTRACTKDYQVPNTNVVLKKDTAILISIMGIQHDPDYFPEPEKFDPKRFSPENKEKLTPFSYMPFGEDPRLCIGLRFAFLQMKIALSMLFKNYKFSINEKTKLPLKIKPKSFVMSPMASICSEALKSQIEILSLTINYGVLSWKCMG
ncbi:hypothetical protein RN001_011122 [Aquatica leii]|uniref:Cytochrome P450 n=1 Tax=Aquatica leii TaxID=1421715 RepID=A0AAN7PAX0_9COLE|nr:hypothetical protein RN001_011122 [Aquatica leii]